MADTNDQVFAQPTEQPVAAPEPAAPVAIPTEPAVPVAETESDRTRREFEKILQNNQQLYQANQLLQKELQQKAQAQQQFAPIQQPPVAQPVAPAVDPRDFIEVDKNGERFINEQKLRARVEELETQTSRAQQAVQSYIQSAEQREIARQEAEAFASYQELNPASPSFDKRFSDATRSLITDSLVNPQDYSGRPFSFKQAADYALSLGIQPASRMTNNATQPVAQPEPTAPAAEPEDKSQLKAVASAQPAGQPPINERARINSDEELTSLRDLTRKGDNEALAKRLANVDHMSMSSEAS